MTLTRDQLECPASKQLLSTPCQRLRDKLLFTKIKLNGERLEPQMGWSCKRLLTPYMEDVHAYFNVCCLCTAPGWRVISSFAAFACVSMSIHLRRFLVGTVVLNILHMHYACVVTKLEEQNSKSHTHMIVKALMFLTYMHKFRCNLYQQNSFLLNQLKIALQGNNCRFSLLHQNIIEGSALLTWVSTQ